jgi:hypothetical protein
MECRESTRGPLGMHLSDLERAHAQQDVEEAENLGGWIESLAKRDRLLV